MHPILQHTFILFVLEYSIASTLYSKEDLPEMPCTQKETMAVESASVEASMDTPAQAKIVAARAAIKARPNQSQGYSDLALALARRARETADADFYEQADEALRKCFLLAPNNVEAERVEIWILLGKHDFNQALEKARLLNKKMPDDTTVYALLADAAIEMGKYEEAEKALQWSFDIRPGEIAALTRGAYLREIFGDLDGAMELMQSAYQKTAVTEVEDRAWILTHLAHLQLLVGKPDLADQILVEALKVFPGYHYAIGQMAKVRTHQNRLDEAVVLLEEHYLASPQADSIFYLAAAQQRAGHLTQAAAAFRHFEKEALNESGGVHNHNRELAFYYADYADRPEEALRFARIEAARRQDVHTLHALAWALCVNGKLPEAQEEMHKVLAIGVRDPVVLYHAGIIAVKLGNDAAARRHFEASLRQTPLSEIACAARKALATLP